MLDHGSTCAHALYMYTFAQGPSPLVATRGMFASGTHVTLSGLVGESKVEQTTNPQSVSEMVILTEAGSSCQWVIKSQRLCLETYLQITIGLMGIPSLVAGFAREIIGLGKYQGHLSDFSSSATYTGSGANSTCCQWVSDFTHATQRLIAKCWVKGVRDSCGDLSPSQGLLEVLPEVISLMERQNGRYAGGWHLWWQW